MNKKPARNSAMRAVSNYKNVGAIRILIATNVLVFVLNLFLQNFFGSDILQRYFSFSTSAILDGKVWTLLTYSFLHESIFHIVINMFVLYFVGSQYEERFGKNKTYFVYFASVLGGALLFWSLSIFTDKGFLIGASAGVIGLFAAYLNSMEDRKMSFILFFVKHVDLRPRVLLYFLAGFELFGLLMFEIAPKASSNSGIGFSAHLGGIAAGLIAGLFMDGHLRNFKFQGFFKGAQKTRRIGSASDYSYKVDIMSDAELRRETNRILDKINTQGFSSLSDTEKRTLNSAKERLK